MRHAALPFAALIALMASQSSSISAENLLQKCVNWYPGKVDWCKQQYPSLIGTLQPVTSDQSSSPPAVSVVGDSSSASKESKVIAEGPVEAVSAVSKNTANTVLFIKIKTSGNVLCATDAPSWVLAEKNGVYYAVNGLARSWRTNMKVYRSGKWHAVMDAGVGPDSVFGMDGTREIINKGTELCPSPPGSFIDVLADQVDAGAEQARRLGSRYGL